LSNAGEVMLRRIQSYFALLLEKESARPQETASLRKNGHVLLGPSFRLVAGRSHGDAVFYPGGCDAAFVDYLIFKGDTKVYHDFNYEATLASSLRAQWQLDDVLRADQELDFSRNFLPESLTRTGALASLNPFEQRTLNQIAAHEYVGMFIIVEEFLLPFVLDHARPELRGDDWRVRALLNFAAEEAKHTQMFKRFHAAFVRGFPVECRMIGPSQAIGAEILRHQPLAVALVILMLEWMSQAHYLGSVRDDGDLDPLFKGMLRHHWMEEAQHAKLDTLMVEALAEGRSEEEIDRAMDEFFEIGAFLDEGLKEQTGFNLDALETVVGRKLDDREAIETQQHQAGRWTFIGSGMVHERFVGTLQTLSPRAAARVAEAAPLFA
jgi:hypothetical protein